MDTQKKVPHRYCLLQGLYWMSYGPVYSFATVYLLERGFSNGQIGTLIGLSCALSAICQPFAAAAADRGTRFSLRTMMIFACLLIMLPAIILVFPHTPIPLTAVCYTILILLHLGYQPLLSALGMQLLNHGYPLDFGLARGIGSIGYAVLAVFLGNLTLRFSVYCLPLLGSLLCFCSMILLRTLPDLRPHGSTRVSSQGTLSLLRTYPRFCLFCVGIVLLFVSHSAINTYMFQILEHIGKGEAELGQVMAYTALLEFLVMIFFLHLVKKRDCGNVLRFCAFFFVCKAAFVPLAGNLLLLYVALLTQALSFALFAPASVYYANAVLPDQDRVKGQALITIAITIGNILGSFLCGHFMELWGVTIAILLTAGIALIGLIFFFTGTEKTGVIW